MSNVTPEAFIINNQHNNAFTKLSTIDTNVKWEKEFQAFYTFQYGVFFSFNFQMNTHFYNQTETCYSQKEHKF